MQVIGEWVEPQSRVLDLGCGRGELMDYLVQAKQVCATGVDLDFGRISACVARGLSAYQGDMTEFMRPFRTGTLTGSSVHAPCTSCTTLRASSSRPFA